jgi:lipopolysaccharide assembly outer membrane protein LptD (OstA)
VDCDEAQFFADEAEIYHDRNRVTATGQVLYVSGGNRISADRMEFDTRARTGTFYNASGVLTLGSRVDRSLFGTQEPDATFRGREVHKIGPDKYRIVDGWFTTCVQPTPRWEISSGNITLNLDDYAWLTNSVFRVKGVPVMYLPAFYYPIQEDDRATGFLIPTYGTSTLKGQIISNAFFWAIGRSHDATFVHDYFSKAGQGYGGEYRYVLGPGSDGNSRVYVLDEREITSIEADGGETTRPAERSYTVTGGVSQRLPAGLRARGNVNYFSSVVQQQRYQQNIAQATDRRRNIGANVSGAWGPYVLNVTADRNDTFFGADSLVTYGSLPRVTVNRGERPIAGTPLYFGVGGEYVTLLRSTKRDDVTIRDQGLTRLDVNPVLRFPFRRWPFLTANSVVAWRGTYWTESLDDDGAQVPDALGRQYFDFNTRITGPVFNRVFNPPDDAGTKFKHVIEPTLSIQRLTAIDQFDRIPKLEGGDYTVGNVTRYSYALSNRLYAKRQVSREVASVTLTQTYYTDANAARFDRDYQSSFTAQKPTHFSPVALHARASPSDRLQAEFRTEWDPTARALRTLAANGSFNRDWLTASAGWSQRRFIEGLPGFDDPDTADHYLNAAVSLRGARNRIGGTYAFNYDLRRDNFLQQRYVAYYNAQCCGIGVEYQTFNFQGSFVGIGVPQDRRFNLSFTLAGIGTFSNFLGAFGGQQDR